MKTNNLYMALIRKDLFIPGVVLKHLVDEGLEETLDHLGLNIHPGKVPNSASADPMRFWAWGRTLTPKP